MKKKKYSAVRAFSKKYAGLVLVVALIIVGITFFQVASLRARYQLEKETSPEIVEIANKAGMSSEGKYLFYSAHPQIVDADEFAKQCQEDKNAGDGLTRGCMLTNSFLGHLSYQIYLRKLENPDYADAIYDSAAHEMLHIAYKRLSTIEKITLNELLDKELERHRDDPRISLYTDDSGALSVISHEEFYCVLGSYYRDVSKELESYFSEYFSNRDGLLKIGEAGLYRSRLDEAARYKLQTEVYGKKLEDLNERLYSNAKEIDKAERARLEVEADKIRPLFNDAYRKQAEISELLE